MFSDRRKGTDSPRLASLQKIIRLKFTPGESHTGGHFRPVLAAATYRQRSGRKQSPRGAAPVSSLSGVSSHVHRSWEAQVNLLLSWEEELCDVTVFSPHTCYLQLVTGSEPPSALNPRGRTSHAQRHTPAPPWRRSLTHRCRSDPVPPLSPPLNLMTSVPYIHIYCRYVCVLYLCCVLCIMDIYRYRN